MSQQKENQVQLLEKISEGSEGVLFQAILNNKLVAVKYQKFQNEDELNLLNKIIQNNKSHIIQVIGVNIYQHYNPVLEIVMELGQQNLYQYIKSQKVNQDYQLKQLSLCLQAAQQIQNLHKFHYFHRDIKPQNFIINGEQILKLIDFGLVKKISSELNINDIGSIRYMAPERFDDQIYNHSVDIWALGLIFFFILTGEDFFQGNTINQIQTMIQKITQQEIIDKLKKQIKNEDYQSLLQEMLRIDKDQRISIQETLDILQVIKAKLNPDNLSKIQNYKDQQNQSNSSEISFSSDDHNRKVQFLEQVQSFISVPNPSIILNSDLLKNQINQNGNNKSTIDEISDNQDSDIFLVSIIRNFIIEIDLEQLSLIKNENPKEKKNQKEKEKEKEKVKQTQQSIIQSLNPLLNSIDNHKIKTKNEKLAIYFIQQYLDLIQNCAFILNETHIIKNENDSESEQQRIIKAFLKGFKKTITQNEIEEYHFVLLQEEKQLDQMIEEIFQKIESIHIKIETLITKSFDLIKVTSNKKLIMEKLKKEFLKKQKIYKIIKNNPIVEYKDYSNDFSFLQLLFPLAQIEVIRNTNKILINANTKLFLLDKEIKLKKIIIMIKELFENISEDQDVSEKEEFYSYLNELIQFQIIFEKQYSNYYYFELFQIRLDQIKESLTFIQKEINQNIKLLLFTQKKDDFKIIKKLLKFEDVFNEVLENNIPQINEINQFKQIFFEIDQSNNYNSQQVQIILEKIEEISNFNGIENNENTKLSQFNYKVESKIINELYQKLFQVRNESKEEKIIPKIIELFFRDQNLLSTNLQKSNELWTFSYLLKICRQILINCQVLQQLFSDKSQNDDFNNNKKLEDKITSLNYKSYNNYINSN